MRALGAAFLFAMLLPPGIQAAGATATEQQIKAVFLFNFSHFVQWPADSFSTSADPFFICVLGAEPFATELQAVVRGEQLQGHPLQVQRFDPAAPRSCHILFVERSASEQLDRALELLEGQSTLTVSDIDRAAERGAMIQFATIKNRIKLRINVEAARGARLTLSSNLLRPAEIVRTGSGN